MQSKVVAPLHLLALRLHDIAEGEGDLTRRVEVKGQNEIDEVGIWFNVFIERIENIVRQVAEHANTLGSAATELAATARETADQAAQQQEQAARISATMGEISTSVHEISQTTQSAAVDARKAEESAHTGGQNRTGHRANHRANCLTPTRKPPARSRSWAAPPTPSEESSTSSTKSPVKPICWP